MTLDIQYRRGAVRVEWHTLPDSVYAWLLYDGPKLVDAGSCSSVDIAMEDATRALKRIAPEKTEVIGRRIHASGV